MDAAEPERLARALNEGWQMRVGRSLGRTLYVVNPEGLGPKDDLCVGIMDSEVLASEIVRRWNLPSDWQMTDDDEP